MAAVAACASTPPAQPDNICRIFEDRPKWYKAAKRSASKWGGPIHLPMAIMYQESAFKRKAKPPMKYFLGFIPTGRASDAYGYSQALKSTWAEYQREIGSSFRGRGNFANAYDFIQWYMHKTYTRNAVSKWDGYAQYLNYHEGQGGYARGTYHGKKWLLNTAARVDQRAKKYSAQLAVCHTELDRNKGWF
ncbi:MAG: transglycosylase SLT domain-containing protein [Gammaproteobacteria bacterium]|nr:transglycosylase SLT domain-containing protein [Gammaproteobacteria bacterium]